MIDETMQSQNSLAGPTPTALAAWGGKLRWVVCGRCDWRFLIPEAVLPKACPYCAANQLEALDLDQGSGLETLTSSGETLTSSPETLTSGLESLASSPESLVSREALPKPELYLPFQVSTARLQAQVEAFASGLWFPPGDLNWANLRERLWFLYLPAWLVDAQAEAVWEAEAGFNYEVVSHQERYNEAGSGWSTRQVKETRVRWEPRRGRLQRAYANIISPAMEEHPRLIQRLGDFAFERSQGYNYGRAIGGLKGARVAIRMPDRDPQAAWLEAQPGFQRAAAEECRQATGADHIRAFNWSPQFRAQNWTLLLLPVCLSYYVDDDGRVQPVLVHGQTGKLSGVKRASMKQAQRASLFILLAAALLFVLSLALSAVGMVASPLVGLGAFGMIAALFLAVLAGVPPLIVWRVNRA